MPETKQLLRETRDRIAPPPDVFDGLERRRRHQENVKRAAAAAVAIVVALIGLGGWFVLERDAARRPADRSEELGIFAPVSGRILYENGGADRGYGVGVWAVDPNGPADTAEGPSVADDVASTLVRLDLEGAEPLGWSSDGTELLLMRSVGDGLFPEQYLSILHADGSETRLNEDPMGISDATISPDGTRVVFAGQYDLSGLYVVDAEGGRPVPLPIRDAGSPTFSPDGTQIAYLAGNRDAEVWVANADGTDAHEILADEPTVFRGVSGPVWSPAGDRLAIGLGTHERSGGSIYTFAPDGSDFTKVIVGGSSPYWSPDGSQIAYTIQCDEDPIFTCVQFDPQAGGSPAGLAIADADGSNVRAFGFAASGPWHPVAADQPTSPSPAPSDSVLRGAEEVLSFTGDFGEPGEASGDLVAVTPGTGEERVLAEDLADARNARWSADGRWVAFETPLDLWVVDRTREPRQVFETPLGVSWAWSPTGAQLAVIRGSTLYVIDPSNGLVTELASLASIVGDVTSPVWSPDGTRILVGVRGGSVYSVDVRTGVRSLVVQLPGEDLDSIDGIEWSPDGSRLLILYDLPGDQRLVVLNPDGSDIRVLADDVLVFGFDWSPDGSRIAFTEDHGAESRVFVAPADGSTPTLVASLPSAPANPVWSPDGSQIAFGHRNAFLTEDAPNLVIDADGSGEAVPLDDLTYESWRGGSYDCDCDILG